MSDITAKASRKMKKYAVLTREPRCFLGSLAFSWEQRKVSDLAEKTYGGGTPTTSNEAYWNGDIPWIQSSDVADGKLLGVESRKRITQDGLNNSAAQLIPENSIAIITRVGVGKLAFMPYSYATSQDFLSLSKLNAEPFFTVYACYKKLQSELNAVQGTSIKGITKDELLAKSIMVPQYAEQRQIGAFFKQLDNLITLHQRQPFLHSPPDISLIVQLTPPFYTFSWEQRKVLSCIQKITDFRGRTPKKLGMDWSESGYLALSALNVKDGYIDFSQDVHYGDQALYDKWMSGNELHKGQVLFTTEAPMGNVAQVPDNRQYILSQRTIAFDVREDIITENFLATLLRSPAVFNTLTSLSSGGTAKGVSQKSLAGVEVRIPVDLREQALLATYFHNLDNLITLHQRQTIVYAVIRSIRKVILAERQYFAPPMVRKSP